MYIVEFHHEGDGLAEPMERLRMWLDREHIQPSVFQLSLIPRGTIFRLEFNIVSEAEAVARAFDGQVIGREDISGVAA